MDILEAIQARHSVRQYQEKLIPEEMREELDLLAQECNDADSLLHLQIVYEDPKCFDSFLAHYGKFEGVSNYIALVAKRDKKSPEALGYWGEHLVLRAQKMGLNSCWVAGTFDRKACRAEIGDQERLYGVIALGFGMTKGRPSHSKEFAMVSKTTREDAASWYVCGVEAALLAPSSLNQQRFLFEQRGEKAYLKSRIGINTRMDLGIARYHFEKVSGHEVLVQ